MHLRECGVRHDHVEAVFALGANDLVRLLARVDALSGFLATDDGENLLAAYKRASNIVAIEEKDGTTSKARSRRIVFRRKSAPVDGPISAASANSAIAEEKYVAAMEAMANLRGPVDLFFDKVTAMPMMPTYGRTGCGCCPNSVPLLAGSPIFPE